VVYWLGRRAIQCDRTIKKLGRNSEKSAVGDRTNLDRTILGSDLLTAAVPILPAFVNTRQAFLADF
jgi:hypothetical protein